MYVYINYVILICMYQKKNGNENDKRKGISSHHLYLYLYISGRKGRQNWKIQKKNSQIKKLEKLGDLSHTSFTHSSMENIYISISRKHLHENRKTETSLTAHFTCTCYRRGKLAQKLASPSGIERNSFFHLCTFAFAPLPPFFAFCFF